MNMIFFHAADGVYAYDEEQVAAGHVKEGLSKMSENEVAEHLASVAPVEDEE